MAQPHREPGDCHAERRSPLPTPRSPLADTTVQDSAGTRRDTGNADDTEFLAKERTDQDLLQGRGLGRRGYLPDRQGRRKEGEDGGPLGRRADGSLSSGARQWASQTGLDSDTKKTREWDFHTPLRELCWWLTVAVMTSWLRLNSILQRRDINPDDKTQIHLSLYICLSIFLKIKSCKEPLANERGEFNVSSP